MNDFPVLDIRPLREAGGPVAIVARAIEVAPGGVDDLIEALRQGAPLYESDGTYLVSLGAVLSAQEFKQLDALAEQETAAAAKAAEPIATAG